MVYKGKIGKMFEAYVLLKRYEVTCNPYKSRYDLEKRKNRITGRNVSIKATKSNTFSCSDALNFLNSKELELIVINYKFCVNNNKAVIKQCYLFDNLDNFFIRLHLSVDLKKLDECRYYVKSLRYPFSKEERDHAHKLGKKVLKKDFCGFRINCRLSSTNQRVQCSLKLDRLLKNITPINNIHNKWELF
jgi:hypothetical protein